MTRAKTNTSVPLITWCQPPDPMATDVIVVNGELLSVEDAARRADVVQRINDENRHLAGRRRSQVGSYGWLARTADKIVGRVPVRAEDATIRPSVAVLAPAVGEDYRGSTARQIVRTAVIAGYRVDESTVLSYLEDSKTDPKGIMARLLDWILGMFGWSRHK